MTERPKQEGDRCGIEGCDGTMEYAPAQDCYCHLCAPCHKCLENPLMCTECGFVEDDDEVSE